MLEIRHCYISIVPSFVINPSVYSLNYFIVRAN